MRQQKIRIGDAVVRDKLRGSAADCVGQRRHGLPVKTDYRPFVFSGRKDTQARDRTARRACADRSRRAQPLVLY